MMANANPLSFPYPFTDRDVYRYSNNAEPLVPPCSIEVTEQYLEEIYLKRQLLVRHPERCYQSFPHTLEAQWEIVDLILHHFAFYYPDKFELIERGE